MSQKVTNDTVVAGICAWGKSDLFPGVRQTYWAAIRAGRLPAIQRSKMTLIRRADLEAWVLEGMPTTPVDTQ